MGETFTATVMRHLKPLAWIWVVAFPIIFVGCGTTKRPTAALSRAEMNLRTATEARADEFAPMELQRAREKLNASKKALEAGEYEQARRLAEIAEVEAELAEAKTDAEITRRAADSLRKSVDALRQEMQRGAIRGSSPATSKE